MSKTLTLAEVAAHDREEDCYLIIGNERTGGAKVYDVTKYLDEHPGGDAVLLELAGKYADDMFEVRPGAVKNIIIALASTPSTRLTARFSRRTSAIRRTRGSSSRSSWSARLTLPRRSSPR